MSSIEITGDERHMRAQRRWLLEALVVVGLLAFAYFAVTVDATATITNGMVSADPAHAFDDLLG